MKELVSEEFSTVLFMKKNNVENSEQLHLSYLNDTTCCSIMPSFYIIEPTNYCNYSCPICPNRLYVDHEKGYMSFDLFEKIVLQIKAFADIIQLYWVGEPLLHPRIFDMISYCKANTRAKVMISTNGSLLSEDNCRKLVASGLDKLIVSMDAADSNEVYNAMRTCGDIAKLNTNVTHLMSYANQLDITLQFILTNVNEIEKDKFVKKWESYGVKISVQCLYTWANQLPELNDFSHYKSPMIGQARVPCADLWYKIAIHWNGYVSRCCFDWSFKNIIGNLNSMTIREVWNASKLHSLRDCHQKLNFDTLCKECDAWATEQEYEYLFE